tara:strand:- start:12926 stop:15094 length:2169 start_codon:yes stop_codon:yes gene_type:complete
MTQLFMDGFDHYGVGDDGAVAMLNGIWGEIQGSFSEPMVVSPGARTGNNAMRFTAGQQGYARRVLGGSETEVIISHGLYLPELPNIADRIPIAVWLTAATACAACVFIQTDGSLEARGPSSAMNSWRSAASLGVSAGPAVVAGTWHHVEARIVISATVGEIEIRVDEVVVLNLTNLNTGSTALTQAFIGIVKTTTAGGATVPTEVYYDDVIVRNTSGTYNNTFMGDLRVATLPIISDGVAQGWQQQTIQKLDIGVGSCIDDTDNDMAFSVPDIAGAEIGSGDFCVETFMRWKSLPVLSEEQTIASKWYESNSERSWRLVLMGPDVGGTLEFQVSTDGSAETIIHAWAWTPRTLQWYHLAVSRTGTTSRLFIDGVQVGIDETDANTYDDNAAKLMFGDEQDSAAGSLNDGGIDGWLDGSRLTVGASRYTVDFTPPTAALPIDVGGDALFASVEFLLNYDVDPAVDESGNAQTVTMHNSALIAIPNDADAYQTVDGLTPNDDDYIEAALIKATGTLTLTANPLDTETVVIGTQTYTFLTSFVDAAANVLIGADAAASLDNLRAAVNLEAGAGSLYGTATVLNTLASASELPNDQMVATAHLGGVAGNSTSTTSTVTGASWADTTLLGGQDIPSHSEFTVGRMPPDVTGVRAVAVVTRSHKSDSGSSELTASFVESGGSASGGAARPMTVSPTYYEDQFETDPATAGALTPNSVLNARIRVDRTA